MFQRKSIKNGQKGQGMSEYLAATALIAVASIGTLGYFGEAIQGQFGAMAREIAGDAVTDSAKAKTAANLAEAQADKHKKLENYLTENNDS